MRLKKCAGCARAIVESATTCDYCGSQSSDAIDTPAPPGPPASTADPHPDVPNFDHLFDSFPSATVPDAAAENMFEPELAAARADGLQTPGGLHFDPAEFDELVIEEFPEHDGAAAYAVPPVPPSQTAAEPHAADPDGVESFFDTNEVSEPAIEVRAPAGATPSHGAGAPSPVPPPSAPAGRWSKQMTMGLLGAAGVGVLIFAILASRGAASPEAAVVTPAAASRQQRAATPAVPSSAAAAPQWRSNPAAWVGRDRRTAAFEVTALNKVPAWMRHVQPILVVRCRATVIEAFVFTDSPAKMEPQDGDHTVRFRFDDQPEVTERWPDSAEHDALFAPNAAAFVRQVAAARTFQFTFSPHNAGDAVVRFNVGGLSEHLAASAKPCGWK